MTGIKPIETIHSGFKFRSRIEARWAVFFESLHIPYEYEKQGYDLKGLWYLPDFYLPKFDCWVEIKGDVPKTEELEKARRLSKAHGSFVVLFAGSFSPEPMVGTAFYYGEDIADGAAWMECPACQHVELLPVAAARFPCLWCVYKEPAAVIRRATIGLSHWCLSDGTQSFFSTSSALDSLPLAC